jgi:asparagine synthase (glutamine-hydrolysing)
MCGIAGYWLSEPSLNCGAAENALRAMATALVHRGPDAEGLWRDDEAGVGFVHRRLSILDVSPAGAQPMQSTSGRYVLIYNGEVYNHLAIRRVLEAQKAVPQWRGHSDTETFLAAIEHWGLEETLERAYGMFALALWDRKERELYLARDRIGEKPLYYGWLGNTFLFGSELKALRAFPGFKPVLHQEAVSAFLRFSYVPAPCSIYQGIYKLRPGHVLRLSSANRNEAPEAIPYWNLKKVAEQGAARRQGAGSYRDLVSETEDLLGDVVQSQMLSDVPLGVFLSGGIDSSLVTALMQARASQPVRSFSIGFDIDRFNEAEYARAIANHLGTEHTEFAVTEKDALDLVPDLTQIFDEPFADSSQLPTILLSRLTREKVTVALSGDGGDEMFGGYNRHILAPMLWERLGTLPKAARQLVSVGSSAAQWLATGQGAAPLSKLAKSLGLPVTAMDRLSKFGGAIGRAGDFTGFYRELVSTWPEPNRLMQQSGEARSILDEPDRLPKLPEPAEELMALDALSYLPDDIMVKVDRSSMSCSLETRAPFLDARVVEHAWTLPVSAKIEGRTGKRILRDILARHVPRELFERPKQGFAVPVDAWLRGGLKDWSGDLLSRSMIEKHGLLDASEVEKVWQAHQAGRDNAGSRLWTVLMLQSWLDAEGHR